MMTVPMQNETNQNISMNSQLNKEMIENERDENVTVTAALII